MQMICQIRPEKHTFVLDEKRIARLLRPYPSTDMQREAIRSDFIRKAPDDPSILEPRNEKVAQTCG